MKYTFKFFQIVLLICGVFGADEVKKVSVMEGESVTLNTDVTETRGIILILWRFGDKGSTIAQIDGKDISYPSHIDIFRGELQLDQTGSLTIKNTRTKHSGLYKLQIDLNSGTSRMTFNVTVYESPAVIGVGKAEIRSVSVNEGDPVILQTDVTELHGDELIVWRFGDEGKLIAKHDIEAKSSLLHDTEERFRDRLKQNEKTGSLTITNIRTTDSGLYTVKISSSKQILYKRFIVTVSAPGLSSGAVAGIVVVLLLVFAAAAAAGMIYYRRKISELQRQLKTVSVMGGEDVTLNTDVTEVQGDDLIEWRFGDKGSLIAEIRGGRVFIYDTGLDEKFLDRLKLDKKTGSLTIMKTRETDSGLYELKISQDSKIKHKKFSVTVCVESVSVFKGDPVTLKTDAEIQRDDLIEWRFGNNGPLIAEIRGGIISKYDDVADGRFRGRLELDKKTGSLTITNTEMKHAADYLLQIKSISGVSNKTFRVVFRDVRNIFVSEGNNVILNPDIEIQKDDQIQWRFGDQDIPIAQIRGGTGETHDDVADGRFRDRLRLDEKTGTLIITDMRNEHIGDYKLQISSSRGTTNKRFVVRLYMRSKSVEEGESVTLDPETEIQKDDQIQWKFGGKDILLAEIRGGTGKTHDAGVRFRDRLRLDEKTGSLTIKNMRTDQSGDYKLQISSSRGTTNMRFVVTVFGRKISVKEGKSVTLFPETDIQKDDQIQWRFGDQDILIAEIRGGKGETDDDDGRFRGRLKLHEKTGNLIITNSTAEDTGVYKLQIRSSRGTTNKTFLVTVFADSSGNRVNDSATVEMPLLN